MNVARMTHTRIFVVGALTNLDPAYANSLTQNNYISASIWSIDPDHVSHHFNVTKSPSNDVYEQIQNIRGLIAFILLIHNNLSQGPALHLKL